MAIDEHRRHELFMRASNALGADAADTLMELLPPVGWADVVTKHDLDLRLELTEQRILATVRGEINTLRSDVSGEINTLRNEMHSEIGSLRNEMHSEIGSLRNEIHGEVGTLHGEIGSLRNEMHSEVGTLHGEVGTLRGEMAGLRADVASQIRSGQTWTIMAMIALSGIVVTAIKI